MPADIDLALSAFSDASPEARPGPELLAALLCSGLVLADMAVTDPGRNRWDPCGSFYCNVPGCRGRAIRFWHHVGIGRFHRYADCGVHAGSELDGVALSLAAAVANWRAVAEDEADQRDRDAP